MSLKKNRNNCFRRQRLEFTNRRTSKILKSQGNYNYDNIQLSLGKWHV